MSFKLKNQESARQRQSWGFFSAFLLALAVFLGTPSTVMAVDADNLIGQYEADGSPSFTKSQAYDSPSRYVPSTVGEMTVDSVNHRMFMADEYNNRVIVYDLDESDNLIDSVIDNVLGQADLMSKVPVASQSGMQQPTRLAYDSDNEILFVADAYARVLVFDVSAITDGEDAISVLGQPDFTSSGTSTTQNGMSGVSGLALDSLNDRLFVTDIGNNRVLVFDVATIGNGENAISVLGQPNFYDGSNNGATQNGLNYPRGLAYDAVNNRLFVADGSNARVLVFDVASISNGEYAASVLGQNNFSANGSSVTQNGLSFGYDVKFDAANGRLFVADSMHRVLMFDISGGITSGMNAAVVFGQDSFSSNEVGESLARFNSGPQYIHYSPATNALHVSDSAGNNGRLLRFDVSVAESGEAGEYVLGQRQYGLSNPRGAAVDSVNGRLFVADTGTARVLVYSLDESGALTSTIPVNVIGHQHFGAASANVTQSGLNGPFDVAYDEVGNRLFVSDSTRLLIYDVSVVTDGMNASYVIGQPDFTSTFYVTTQNGFSSSGDIAYDQDNDRIFVTDLWNNRVLVFDMTAPSNGMDATYVLGQVDFTSSSSGASSSGMYGPVGIEYDAIGERLFVMEWFNHRVTVFDLSSGIASGMSASYVLGQSDWDLNEPATSQSGMYYPYGGLAYVASTDRLYVADSANARVLEFDLSSGLTNGMDAFGIFGQSDFVSNTPVATQSGMGFLSKGVQGPAGLAYAENGNILYVSDTGNNRVLVFNIDTSAGDGGSASNPPPQDMAAPRISAVTAEDVTADTAAVSWLTNEAATSLVNYGTTAAYGSSTGIEYAFVTSHYRTLEGLNAGTTYHYQVCSRDSAANQACSDDATFMTVDPSMGDDQSTSDFSENHSFDAPGFSSGPVIPDTGPAISDITSGGATITWTTDRPAGTHIEYGTSIPYSHDRVIDGLVTNHVIRLTGLSPGTTYHFRVASQDASAMRRVWEDMTFTTSP